MKAVFSLVLIAFVASAMGGAVSLTGDNFDSEVVASGKGAFIKFQAPWCGHCKKMKPAWDKLGDEFADSATVIIGDVDCTVEKSLCSQYGVRGYPTIKYFTGATASEGDKYEGGRDFETLKKFASESLGPSCSPDNLDLCDDEQKENISAAQALSPEDRKAQIAEKVAAIDAAEENFKAELEKLQARYTELMEEKDATIASIQPSLSVLRSIKDAPADDAAHDEL